MSTLNAARLRALVPCGAASALAICSLSSLSSVVIAAGVWGGLARDARAQVPAAAPELQGPQGPQAPQAPQGPVAPPLGPPAAPPLAAVSTDEPVKPRRVTLSYFGDKIQHPGGRVGYEAAMWFRPPHELLLGATIGGYYDPAGWGLFIFGEGGYRITLSFGLFFDVRVGLGYNAVTRPGMVYSNFEGAEMVGPPIVSNYLMPLGFGGLGYDFYRVARVPISLFARAGIFGQYASNEPFLGSYALDAGIAYQFGTGKPRRPELPVPEVPLAEAPPDLDSRSQPVVPPSPTTSTAPAAPTGPAEPAPPATAPTPAPLSPSPPR